MPAGPGVKLGSVPFTEAADFFRQKLRLPTKTWTDIVNGAHSRAFVVAGAESDALLADFQESLIRLRREGGLLADFRKEFDAIVAKHGWEHTGSAAWRSRVIFQTNMRTANAAGRWAQIQRVKDRRPWLRYVAVMDNRTRPLHRAWHGTVLRADDPWWQTHFPPNGWNCRCTVQQLSDADLKTYGYAASPSAPPSPLVRQVVRSGGAPIVVTTPQGIDYGFAYNPGIAWQGVPVPTRLDARGVWPSLDPPGTPREFLAPLLPQAIKAAEAAAPAGESAESAFSRMFAGDAAVLDDPLGGRVDMGAGLPPTLEGEDVARFVPFLPQLIGTPGEIRIAFQTVESTGRVLVKRRYVGAVELGGRTYLIAAQFDAGRLEAFTILPQVLKAVDIDRLRSGTLLYRDPLQIGGP